MFKVDETSPEARRREHGVPERRGELGVCQYCPCRRASVMCQGGRAHVGASVAWDGSERCSEEEEVFENVGAETGDRLSGIVCPPGRDIVSDSERVWKRGRSRWCNMKERAF